MTAAEAWRTYEAANTLARYHYRAENHCPTCAAPRPFYLTRRPVLCDECRNRKARA